MYEATHGSHRTYSEKPIKNLQVGFVGISSNYTRTNSGSRVIGDRNSAETNNEFISYSVVQQQRYKNYQIATLVQR